MSKHPKLVNLLRLAKLPRLPKIVRPKTRRFFRMIVEIAVMPEIIESAKNVEIP